MGFSRYLRRRWHVIRIIFNVGWLLDNFWLNLDDWLRNLFNYILFLLSCPWKYLIQVNEYDASTGLKEFFYLSKYEVRAHSLTLKLTLVRLEGYFVGKLYYFGLDYDLCLTLFNHLLALLHCILHKVSWPRLVGSILISDDTFFRDGLLSIKSTGASLSNKIC